MTSNGEVTSSGLENEGLARLRHKVTCSEDLGRLTMDALRYKVHAVAGEFGAWIDGASQSATNDADIAGLDALTDVLNHLESVAQEHFPLSDEDRARYS